MKFRRSICFAVLLTVLLTFLVPTTSVSVYAGEDNSPNLPPYKNDLLYERTFDEGLCFPWHTCEDSGGKCSFDVVDVPGQPGNKAFALTVLDKGQNKWSVQMRHRGIALEQGHTYRVRLKIWSEVSCKAYIKIGQMAYPYEEYWNNKWSPYSLTAGKVLEIDETFIMEDPSDDACEFTFHLGGELAGTPPYTVYLDDVSLYDAEYSKPVVDELKQPDVRVNQVGYLPQGKKVATVLCDSKQPVEWQLLNAAGVVVMEGVTEPKGLDKDSQDNVHWIDFSDFTTQGIGYRFELPTVNTVTNYSHPFDIRDDIYTQMKYDALSFFYHKRSGIAIEMPYAGGEQWTRPAGHIGIDPNTGDTSVPTWPQSDEYAGLPQKSYSKDVTGGWYDAGDHGKYVVNGGIAVWTLMNMYERAKINGLDNWGPYKDGGMNIPEQNNGYPDILDEARWEIEFFKKMQVTEKEDPSIAGMVHHKIHDFRWTALGMLPHEDSQERYLRPVSTAATLNFAATLAQSARLWEEFDPVFAADCLEKAEIAWQAALKNPEIYAEYTPGSGGPGGGPYNDDYTGDEFYWAACELYATTGKSEYKEYLMKSPHYLEMPAMMKGTNEDDGLWGCFTWGTTQGLGTITLALAENGLPATEIQKAKNNIMKAADAWLANIEDQGYRLPIKQAEDERGGYPWGSNSFLLNQMIVMAYARDFSSDSKYFDGILDSMSYLLGRNAMDQSYVTGYGERPLTNPHDRFWTPQTSSKWPAPPPGIISGGPNSRFEDPTINAAVKKDTPPQKCFIDHTDSWSTNEITVNWNAPFSWITAYLDEQNTGSETEKVTIDSPVAGERYEAGKDVNISASVKADTTVSKVEFYNGDTLISSDASAPYTAKITAAAAGAYDLKAVAVLSDGRRIESPITSILVKVIVKPTVKLTAPKSNVVAYGNEFLKITATGSDSDGKISRIDFLVDGKVIGSDKEAPFEYEWKAVEGDHEISVIAYDDDNAASSPDSVKIFVKQARDVKVQYMCDGTQASNQEIKGKFNIVNTGNRDYSLKDLVLRYYFTKEANSQLQFNCYYTPVGSGNLIPSFGGSGDEHYLQLEFKDVKLPAGGQSGEIQFVIRYADNSVHDQSNDYSFDPTIKAFQDYDKVTLYKNGELVWGTPPGGIIIEPEIIYGDCNDDGKVTSTDLTVLKRHLLKMNVEINLENADVNTDGKVTSTDVTILKRYLTKIIKELPI
ncbi:glycoside hydrolase family 9 protein [Acetivibrio mesophilus]|uniref:Endoglucanase n=1 Tax=Acetivibrio mesophilus TaxID=2487273 RepID=A0A4Q0IB48_9FIRM|nr:glycoside hydrolase family 9 protein [Acetivibrio mesophilus]ODM25728.1 cellulose 1,4-beta-cellobiosidase [Clostridium sp. Bc-iso-3]RXE60312.1 cellulose 1,4-beta-cellobiosidase [Acetivibrio mesophilus]HHV30437.1 cellulose 1,4-beta-cellobiosidase [Clostridium sp.]